MKNYKKLIDSIDQHRKLYKKAAQIRNYKRENCKFIRKAVSS